MLVCLCWEKYKEETEKYKGILRGSEMILYINVYIISMFIIFISYLIVLYISENETRYSVLLYISYRYIYFRLDFIQFYHK